MPLTVWWISLRNRLTLREDGASLVEYALLIGLIAIVCILAITFLGHNASGRFSSYGSAVDASGR